MQGGMTLKAIQTQGYKGKRSLGWMTRVNILNKSSPSTWRYKFSGNFLQSMKELKPSASGIQDETALNIMKQFLRIIQVHIILHSKLQKNKFLFINSYKIQDLVKLLLNQLL